MDLGSALLDGEGNASLQTDVLPAGTHQVVAVYTGQTRLSDLQLEARVGARQCIHGCRVYRRRYPHVAVHSGGRFCKHRGHSNAGQWVQCLCQPFLQRACPSTRPATFTPLSVPASCTTSASGVQTCTPGSSAMQIQTLAPPPKYAAFRVASGVCLPGLVGLAAPAKRRAWRNMAVGRGGTCRRYGHEGLLAALQLSQSRTTRITPEPRLAPTRYGGSAVFDRLGDNRAADAAPAYAHHHMKSVGSRASLRRGRAVSQHLA